MRRKIEFIHEREGRDSEVVHQIFVDEPSLHAVKDRAMRMVRDSQIAGLIPSGAVVTFFISENGKIVYPHPSATR